MNNKLSNEQLMAAANAFGTPLYVYNTDKITEQYNKLTSAFSAHPTKLFYACKALTNINILKHLKSLGSNLDCVSINEVKLGLKAGFAPKEILYTPNCVAFEEIKEAVALGVNINIDSIAMLELFGNFYGDSYPICIRINPHIEAGGNYKISTGHIDSKFGISIHQIRHIVRVVKTTKLHIQGLHMHTGSEIKDINVFLQALEVLFSVAEHFDQLEFLDLGSGFKVPYKEEDRETDIVSLGQKLNVAIKEFEKEYGKPLEIWFEPGKYLVSVCGYLVVNANVIKQTTATVFVGVNSGFNHLIRPMFYDSYHKIANISNAAGAERIYTVVGNICETDTFAWDRVLNEVREDDLLVFYNAGAYGFEMSSNFNSRLKPAEVMFKDGQFSLIRERQVFDDLLAGQIIG
jgi:diaminopimelate decarboxylase